MGALLALTLSTALGCVGGEGPDPLEGSSSALVDEGADLQPLAVVTTIDDPTVPAGCEGRLHRDQRFAVTPDTLVAALSDDGDVLCIDSLGSVEIELAEVLGDPAAAAALHTRVRLHLAGIQPTSSSAIAGGDEPKVLGAPAEQEAPSTDPHPQPSQPAGDGGEAEGDPHPQPSHPGPQGDPHPQPSCPTPDGDAATDPIPTDLSAAPVLERITDPD
jgi:hypothetical protein